MCRHISFIQTHRLKLFQIISLQKKKKCHLRWLCCHLHETSGGAGGCASIYPSRFFIHSRLMRQLLTAPTGGERLVPPLLSDKFTSIIVQLQQLETRRPAFQKFLPNFNFETHQPAHHSIALNVLYKISFDLIPIGPTVGPQTASTRNSKDGATC